MRPKPDTQEARASDIIGHRPDEDAATASAEAEVPRLVAVDAPATPEAAKAATETDAPRKARVDLLQLVFWLSVVVAVAAATVSIALRDAVGETGSILLISLAATGMVVLLWLARGAGRWLGLFPERGAAETAVSSQAAKPRFPWIESLDEAALVTERGGAPVTCNTAFRELSEIAAGLGESHGPVTVDRLFGGSPGVAAPVYKLSRAAKAGKPASEDLPAVAMGRDETPVQFSASVAPLPGGKVLWRLRDTTGKTSSNVAADPKALYIEEAPVGFFVSRPDGTIAYMNGWLRELLGLPESESAAKVDDFMRPESLRMLRRERRGDNVTRAQLTLIARDGVPISVQSVTMWTGRGLDASGRTIVTTGGAALLSKAERSTAPSASRPATGDSDPMFDDAPFGVCRLVGDTVESATIYEANPAMMALTEGRAAPGAVFNELFLAEEGEAVLAETLVDSIDRAVGLQLAGEETRHVNVRIALDETGAPSIAYVMDLTAQKELENRLYQGEKMQALGNLAGELAHEFNNALTGIILNCDKLMIRHPVGDPSYVELKQIHEWAARAAEFIRMLKAYARKETLKRQVIDVTEWLSEFSILLRQLVDERVQIDISHGRDLPKIRFDKSQLEASLMNLATNARDAMLSGGGGQLKIRTEPVSAEHAHARGFNYVEGGDYLLIEVADTGTGIPADKLSRIFEPFFTTKEKGRGTGLGLSTVYGIVKQSGGYICVASEIGKGTTFYLYLPALSAMDAEASNEEETPTPVRRKPADISGRGRILLVEDEHGVRGIAMHLLKSCGYDVVDAEDGEKALAIIEENPGGFDLLISDVVLPGIDGPSLLKKARTALGDARVIFISGYAERDLAKALDEETEVAFLPKPFTLRQLAEKVKEELNTVGEAAA